MPSFATVVYSGGKPEYVELTLDEDIADGDAYTVQIQVDTAAYAQTLQQISFSITIRNCLVIPHGDNWVHSSIYSETLLAYEQDLANGPAVVDYTVNQFVNDDALCGPLTYSFATDISITGVDENRTAERVI